MPETDTQTRHAATLTLGTLASRILGFVRDLCIAHLLGPAADALVLAFRVPNVIRRMGAEGGIGMAYSPWEARVLYRQGHEAALIFARRVFLFMLFAGALAAVLLLPAAGLLITLLAPGAAAGLQAGGAHLLRLCLPFIPLSLAAYTAFAHAAGRSNFGPQAWSSAILNIAILCTAGFAFCLETAAGITEILLCAGMVAGGLLQALIGARLLAPWRSSQSLFRPEADTRKATRAFFLRFPAATLGAAPHQAHFLAVTILASFLAPGGISSLYFAERLLEFPLAVAGAAIGTAALPRLAACAQQGLQSDFAALLGKSLRAGAFLSLPAAAGLIALAAPLTEALFLHGAFTPEAAAVTTAALTGYAAGLPALCASRPALAAVNAFLADKSALHAALASLALLLACSMGGLALYGDAPADAALCLGASLAAASWCNLALLLRRLTRHNPQIAPALRAALSALYAYTGAAVLMAAALALFCRVWNVTGLWPIAMLTTATACIWLVGFYGAGNKDARALAALLRRQEQDKS